MRADYRLQRLHVGHALGQGLPVVPDAKQLHYLLHVLRMTTGGRLLVFNGRDGEWLAEITEAGKRDLLIRCVSLRRPQADRPDLEVLFAPLKVGRLDYLVQKLVEMGAGRIRPVITDFTQNRAVKSDKLAANIIEAAEQCGVLALPDLDEPAPLPEVLDRWDATRRLVFCDEAAEGNAPLPILSALPKAPAALLIGPEGGFSDAERVRLRSLPFVTAIPLGPRILRADTAAVAAMALMQATIGDWRG